MSSQSCTRPEPTAASSGAKGTVLVAEDEVLVRLVVADEFRESGFEVIEALNADEVLAVLNTGTHIDLLMTDVQMPGRLNGRELASLVRDCFPNVKIIIGSANLYGLRDDAVADAVFAKPYDFYRLMQCVRRLLHTGTAELRQALRRDERRA
jgi:CheY-like chemotaxis protein